MLPSVWFYIALVTFGWALLLYVELRRRASQHVKGCPSLPYISPRRMDSRILIDSDVIVIELSAGTPSDDKPHIPDALKLSIVQLESFLRQASRNWAFVLYDSAKDPVDWRRVECIVNHDGLPQVFVLRGGLEAWLANHRTDGMATVS